MASIRKWEILEQPLEEEAETDHLKPCCFFVPQREVSPPLSRSRETTVQQAALSTTSGPISV